MPKLSVSWIITPYKHVEIEEEFQALLTTPLLLNVPVLLLGHFILGGWVSPRADLDSWEKTAIPSPCWESNPASLVVQSIV
jgi:hypothetical protein